MKIVDSPRFSKAYRSLGFYLFDPGRLLQAGPQRLSSLYIWFFSEQGLKRIKEEQLLGACQDLLSRLADLPAPCQFHITAQIFENIPRLSENKKELCHFVENMLKDSTYLCPACHYLSELLWHIKNSIRPQ
ncbi:hypothetical protein ABK905_17725 [Acerihabitans sp. KWT182]|uniref:Uncharacterized protein n=1 Tax=Acerihabitans sp. KWT182 TaxID=3157919 RepID=A0AAU7Q644_9GAMM